ncbi:MAG: sigma-70 family RNA polymerase sigma factor [Capsulimonadaceae bacterium]
MTTTRSIDRAETPAARREVFTRLARAHEGELLRAARRMYMGNEEKALDLVQDALVRAYQACAQGHFDGTNARAWLMRILTNVFINDYRRGRKWDAGITVETLTSSGEAGPPQTHAAPADMPGVDLLAGTLDEEIESAINALTEPLRLCVLLVDVEGLDYAEAAAALNIPIGTVRSRLSRARMQLHDLLRDFARRKGLLKSS